MGGHYLVKCIKGPRLNDKKNFSVVISGNDYTLQYSNSHPLLFCVFCSVNTF